MATQTTTTQYPAWLEDMMKQVASETGRLYDAGAYPQFFQGNTVAPFTADQTAGQSLVRGQINNTSPDGVRGSLAQAQGANTAFLDPNMIWNLQNIPGYNAIREGITRDVGRNLSENYMPSVREGSIMSGFYGGSRGQIGEALAAARSTEELTKGLGALDSGMFNTLLQAQQNAIIRAPGLATAQLMPGQALQDLGQTIQNQNQTQITGDREKWEYDQAKPWWLLDQLRTSAGMARGGQTTQTKMKESDPNIWQTIGGIGSLLLGSQNGGNNPWYGTPPYVPGP